MTVKWTLILLTVTGEAFAMQSDPLQGFEVTTHVKSEPTRSFHSSFLYGQCKCPDWFSTAMAVKHVSWE